MSPTKTLADLENENGGSTQTVTTASGATLPDKYKRLGGHVGGFNPRPLHRLDHFFIGPVGQGKTQFVASAPRCAFVDVEEKTDHIAHWGKGTVVFPGRSGADVAKLFDELISDGKADRRAFDMVAVDPINGYVQTARRYLTEQYVTAGLLKINPKTGTVMGDITGHGKEGSGWEIVNQFIRNQLAALREAGYAIITTAHLFPRWIRDTRGNETVVARHHLNDGVRTHIYKDAAFCGIISRETRSVEVPTGKFYKVDGESIPQTETVFQKTYTLDVLPPPSSQDGIAPETRQHIAIDKPIILPARNGWQAYEEVYNEAVERRRKELGQAQTDKPKGDQ